MDNRPAQERASVAKGRYRLGRRLGEGGMGSVFEGVDTISGRGVAVKVLRREVATDEQIVRRFLLEAETLSKIRHKNIVQLIESGQEDDGSLYIVQELLSGYDLRSKLEGQRMPVREAFDIAVPIMGALVTAHEQGVLHRDIKPENIFITRGQSGETYPKLIDFGLSKTTRPQPENLRLTQSGMPIGTPFYMSPEQARAEENLSGQADVWSLATVIYEMIAGRCPFQESNLGLLMFKILSEPVPRIEQFAPQVPPDVAALLHRALDSDRAKRWPTMRDFLFATLECPSLAAGPGEVDLLARHRESIPKAAAAVGNASVNAFAKTMGAGADQSGSWNPARTSPFLLTPGAPGMKREIDSALEMIRARNAAQATATESTTHPAVTPQRSDFASTLPGATGSTSASMAAAKPNLSNTFRGPGALAEAQAASPALPVDQSAQNTIANAGASITVSNGRDEEHRPMQVSDDIPAANEEAFSLGPSVAPGNSLTPPPSETNGRPGAEARKQPWLAILVVTVLVSGAATFAYMKFMRGSQTVAPPPPVAATITDAGTPQSSADVTTVADAAANANADAGAAVNAAAEPNPAPEVAPTPTPAEAAPETEPAQQNANTATHTTSTRHNTSTRSSSGSSHRTTHSSGGGLNIIDPAALQRATQQEGH